MGASADSLDRQEKRGRESFFDMEESLPVEGIVCRVVHVLLRVRLPTMS